MATAGTCGQCQRHPPAFRSPHVSLRYQDQVVTLIHRYKFGGDLHVGSALAAVMLGDQLPDTTRLDCLVPVPLHLRRLRERGFNQSLELARLLSRETAIPCRRTGVTRTIDCVPQSGLKSWSARRRNVRDVFHVKQGLVSGQNVAIVDDVMTSGATAHALSRALLAAGARQVTAWVAARAG